MNISKLIYVEDKIDQNAGYYYVDTIWSNPEEGMIVDSQWFYVMQDAVDYQNQMKRQLGKK